MDTKAQIESIIGVGRVKTDVNLTPFTTLKTKTNARYFFEAETRDDLVAADAASRKTGTPLFLIGGGSNLVITSNTINALVIVNRYIQFEVLTSEENSSRIAVSSGYPVNLLVQKTIEVGLSGFEYHLGLPGTVGGALYMNSKWTRPVSYFGDCLEYAQIIDQSGKIVQVPRDYFEFAYDHSILQSTKEMILEAVFKLSKTDSAELKKKALEALKYRKQTQPFGQLSSGCFFKNISVEEQKKYGLPTSSAGYLIDKAGLKGTRIGGFYVSQLHANFILNQGAGTPQDLALLLSKIKETVKQKFHVDLHEEVIVI